jgi:hypothetical protein
MNHRLQVVAEEKQKMVDDEPSVSFKVSQDSNFLAYDDRASILVKETNLVFEKALDLYGCVPF